MRSLIGILLIPILTACASIVPFANNPSNTLQKSSSNFLAKLDYTKEIVNPPGEESTSDLWSRIRQDFQIPNLQNNLVDIQVAWYTNRPNYMKRMIDRSKKYLYYIVDGLEARHMPSEIAILPFIESAYDPQASSISKAVGIWQFIPETGRIYNLRQNMWKDDRRDLLASTHAALDYLSSLYDMFGDWYLVLAAYNWGEGNVRRAILHNQTTGLPTDYQNLKIPRETRNYVPKLQALKNIISHPENYGFVLQSIPNRPYFTKVSTFRDIDISIAAKLACLPIDEFKSLNPSFKTPVILHATDPKILLPSDNAVIFLKNLKKYKGRLSLWTTYTVKKRARPNELARNLGIDVNALISINKIPIGMRLKPGSILIVPQTKEEADISMAIAENGHLIMEPDIPYKHKRIHAHKDKMHLIKRLVRIYKKQTMTTFAKRYGVSVKQLLKWNNSHHKILIPGQVIVLHIPTYQSMVFKSRNKKRVSFSVTGQKTTNSNLLLYHSRTKIRHRSHKKASGQVIKHNKANNRKIQEKFKVYKNKSKITKRLRKDKRK